MNLKSSILAVRSRGGDRRWGAGRRVQTAAGAGQRGTAPAGQQGPRSGTEGRDAWRGGGAGQMTPAELERWLDSYVLLQAQETLKLTDAQFPRFVQRLKALQETAAPESPGAAADARDARPAC